MIKKGIIKKINLNNDNLLVIEVEGGILEYYYLAKSIIPIFERSLAKEEEISFKVGDELKKINEINHYVIDYIVSIKVNGTEKYLFNINNLIKEMYRVLSNIDYFLVIDFETTMPTYQERFKRPEIIQAGYYLVDSSFNIIKEKNFYLSTVDDIVENPKIFKMISIDEGDYYNEAVPYINFYNDLKEILDTYKAKLVIWGASDKITLKDSYKINNLPALTTDNNFINLLQLHKNYYMLKQDIGLYKAYSLYYECDEIQDHNALHDAYKTLIILREFIKKLKEYTEALKEHEEES